MALSPHMNVMIKAAEKAGRSLVRDFGEVEQLQVSRKGPGDFVSAADHRAEDIIYNELSKARPDYAFLMEERGEVKVENAECRWIVDPLDGTANFLHGIPHWCVSIALEKEGEIIAGCVFSPVLDEMFRAERGEGAFMRHKRLRVSSRSDVEMAVAFTGAPHRSNKKEQFAREYKAVQDAGISMRRFGAAALDLCYVAAGRCEAFWESDISAWDMAAGDLIVREAGGLTCQIDGKSNPVFNKNILAANAALFDDFKKILRDVGREKDAA